MDSGKEVCGKFVVSGGDAPEILKLAKHALDAIACAIQHRAEAGFPFSIDARRDVWRGNAFFDRMMHSIGATTSPNCCRGTCTISVPGSTQRLAA